MTVRETLEKAERERLSPYAMLSEKSRGRERPINPDNLRTQFQRDRDRILHSKSFRRLQFKTQVFLSPEGDHYRSRLTHTLEVAQVARTIARALRLNEDLAEAIALAHDLGHTPFGHIGERALNRLNPDGFRHYEQSLRVVEVLEGRGGLNLTWEVRDGILNHSQAAGRYPEAGWSPGRTGSPTSTMTSMMRSGRDPEALRPAGELSAGAGPYPRRAHRHPDQRHRLYQHGAEDIQSSEEVQAAADGLREFLFARVTRTAGAPRKSRSATMCSAACSSTMEHPAQMPLEFVAISYQSGTIRAVCDYIASMTDRFALRSFQHLFVPDSFPAI